MYPKKAQRTLQHLHPERHHANNPTLYTLNPKPHLNTKPSQGAPGFHRAVTEELGAGATRHQHLGLGFGVI